MKVALYTRFLYILGVVVLTSCAEKEDLNEALKEKIVVDASQFTLSEETYGKEVEITRANKPKSDIKKIDLGNGIEAEVVVEHDNWKDSSKVRTRAQEISNQHYTINAFDNSNNLVGTLKGTVSGNGPTKSFVPDAGTPEKLILEPGSYSFVCFNDKVIFNNNKLIVTDANASQALIGRTRTTVSGSKYRVHFEMKHQAARVRFQMKTYWKIENITAKIVPAASDPHILTYNSDATGPQYSSSPTSVSKNYTFPNKTISASDFVYTSMSDYQYYLPMSKGNEFKLYFQNGELYEKSLVNKMMTFDKFPRIQLAANESYVVKIKLYYTYKYLFSDGTTGTLLQGKAAGKTPIGVVATDKTSGSEGLAFALKVAGNYRWSNTVTSYQNTQQFINQIGVAYDENGYNWTWNAAYSRTGSAHANDNNFPAFFAAAHYTNSLAAQGITMTGSITNRNWFLPSLGEWRRFLIAAAKYDNSMQAVSTWGGHLSHDILDVIYIQAGGMPISGSTYQSSSEADADHGYYMGLDFKDKLAWRVAGSNSKLESWGVIPALHF